MGRDVHELFYFLIIYILSISRNSILAIAATLSRAKHNARVKTGRSLIEMKRCTPRFTTTVETVKKLD